MIFTIPFMENPTKCGGGEEMIIDNRIIDRVLNSGVEIDFVPFLLPIVVIFGTFVYLTLEFWPMDKENVWD